MSMLRPSAFIINHQFRHQSPDFVRALALRAGFEQKTPGGTKRSEIWSKADGNGDSGSSESTRWDTEVEPYGRRRKGPLVKR